MDTFRRVLDARYRTPDATPQRRLAVVVAVAATTATVTVGGDPTAVAGVPWLASALPAVADTVVVDIVAGAPLIVGIVGAASRIPHSETLNTVGAADTTTSATYVNLAATSSMTFTKLHGSTALELALHATSFSSATGTVTRFAVRIDSVDYDVCQLFWNVANSHAQTSGVAKVGSGVVAAGSYTVQGRWRRVSGTGTLTRDTGDWLSMQVSEVMPDA